MVLILLSLSAAFEQYWPPFSLWFFFSFDFWNIISRYSHPLYPDPLKLLCFCLIFLCLVLRDLPQGIDLGPFLSLGSLLSICYTPSFLWAFPGMGRVRVPSAACSSLVSWLNNSIFTHLIMQVRHVESSLTLLMSFPLLHPVTKSCQFSLWNVCFLESPSILTSAALIEMNYCITLCIFSVLSVLTFKLP